MKTETEQFMESKGFVFKSEENGGALYQHKCSNAYCKVPYHLAVTRDLELIDCIASTMYARGFNEGRDAAFNRITSNLKKIVYP